MPEQNDVWWPLDIEPSQEQAIDALREVGLSWLGQFTSRHVIFDKYWAGDAAELGMTPAAALDIADLLLAIGNTQAAEQTVRNYLASDDMRWPHRDYVENQYLELRNLRHLLDKA